LTGQRNDAKKEQGFLPALKHFQFGLDPSGSGLSTGRQRTNAPLTCSPPTTWTERETQLYFVCLFSPRTKLLVEQSGTPVMQVVVRCTTSLGNFPTLLWAGFVIDFSCVSRINPHCHRSIH
jgi:hypothetical protein